MKNQNGVTLITLTITIVIMIILTFTIAVNIEPYKNQKTKVNFETDMQRLTEEINQYYVRVKDIPIINKFTNTTMLEGIKNINDNDEYYVIDIKQLDVKLNYGADYYIINRKDETEEITDLLDVYIINKQSHTIYYPKGVEYSGRTHYRIAEKYHEIEESPIVPTDIYFQDGRRFYAHTIKFTTADVSGTYDTNIKIDNIDNVCFETSNSYLYTDNGNTYAQVNTYYTANAYFLIWFDKKTNHIMYKVGPQYVNSQACVTIKYTIKNDSKEYNILSTDNILSEKEKFTGMYDNDGKKIYSMSKQITTSDVSGSSLQTNMIIEEAEKVFIDLTNSYLYNKTQKVYSALNTYYSTEKYFSCWFNTNSSSIRYHLGSEDVNSEVFLTLRYTKKEDKPTNVTDNSKILSEQEIYTGNTLEGKKVYRISKSYTTNSEASSNIVSSVNIPNANIVMIDYKNSYLYTDRGNTYAQLNTHYNDNARCQNWFTTSTKFIRYHLGPQYINSNAFITLLYTKE